MMSRPLSPHLTWYKPQITSTLSFMHRFSGIVLAVGSIGLSWWVVAAALGGGAYATTTWVYGSVGGTVVLILWTIALAFHLSNGIRHLFWDVDIGFDMTAVNRSGVAVLIMTAVLTAAVWLIVFLV